MGTLVSRKMLNELDLQKLAEKAKKEFKAQKTLVAKTARSWQSVMYHYAREEINDLKAKALRKHKIQVEKDRVLGKGNEN